MGHSREKKDRAKKKRCLKKKKVRVRFFSKMNRRGNTNQREEAMLKRRREKRHRQKKFKKRKSKKAVRSCATLSTGRRGDQRTAGFMTRSKKKEKYHRAIDSVTLDCEIRKTQSEIVALDRRKNCFGEEMPQMIQIGRSKPVQERVRKG